MYQVKVNPTDFLILVVDDSKSNVLLLSHILTDYGFKVEKSYSGKEALKKIKETKPDLILMDILMPKISGLEVGKAIKGSDYDDIPIIFLSESNKVGDQVKAFEIGGVDFISKPLERDELIIRVRNHLMIKVIKQEADEQLEELKKRELELEESNQKKYKLMMMLSHDIKNPISGIMGLASILIEDEDIEEEERNEMLEMIHNRSEGLVDIVKDLLDKELFSEKFAKGLFEEINIVSIIQEAVKKNTSKAVLKEVDLTINASSEEIRATLDEIKIRYIFQTLISNLIKSYTSEGSIKIEIEEITKDKEEVVLIKIVCKNLGIPNTKLSKFLISLNQDQTKKKGLKMSSNLDLEEVRNYLKAHKGSIRVENNDETETSFFLELPKGN